MDPLGWLKLRRWRLFVIQSTYQAQKNFFNIALQRTAWMLDFNRTTEKSEHYKRE